MTQQAYNEQAARELITATGAEPRMLVQILRSFLDHFGFVDDKMIRLLASELNLTRAEVHGVVSFYDDFRTTPAGQNIVKICQAEACQAMGSRALTDHAKKSLGIEMHATTDDGAVTLEPVYCLGNCACSPAVMINDDVYGRVDAAAFDGLIGKHKGRAS